MSWIYFPSHITLDLSYLRLLDASSVEFWFWIQKFLCTVLPWTGACWVCFESSQGSGLPPLIPSFPSVVLCRCLIIKRGNEPHVLSWASLLATLRFFCPRVLQNSPRCAILLPPVQSLIPLASVVVAVLPSAPPPLFLHTVGGVVASSLVIFPRLIF